jgi:hypothetical protein
LRRWLWRIVRVVLLLFVLFVLLITVEILAGWRCADHAEIPAPVSQPKERRAAVAGIKDYFRPEDDAYLSLPEWYIVWSYQEKADFQKLNPPSAFPYFGAVRQYWGNYCCISRLTRGKYGFNWGEQVMLVVIGNSFSAEYILKGLYEKTVGRFSEWTAGPYPGTEEDFYAYRVARDYADFVHVRPFYEFHFAPHIVGVWSENHFWGDHLFRKWERRAFLTVDYTIEAFYCWLIEKATHASYGYEPDRTYVWADHVDDASALQTPSVRLAKSVGLGAYIIDAPRYQAFTDVAMALTRKGAHFVEIDGNSSITISVLAPQTWDGQNQFAQRLFAQPMLTHPGWERVVLRCDVPWLDRGLSMMVADGVIVEHLYDY